MGILKKWTPYIAIFVMELFKFFENIFNRMLILTDTILGILLFKQGYIYFPLVIIAPQNCVVRSSTPVTISFISWNSSLVVSTSENRFDILTRWSALWTSSVLLVRVGDITPYLRKDVINSEALCGGVVLLSVLETIIRPTQALFQLHNLLSFGVVRRNVVLEEN